MNSPDEHLPTSFRDSLYSRSGELLMQEKNSEDLSDSCQLDFSLCLPAQSTGPWLNGTKNRDLSTGLWIARIGDSWFTSRYDDLKSKFRSRSTFNLASYLSPEGQAALNETRIDLRQKSVDRFSLSPSDVTKNSHTDARSPLEAFVYAVESDQSTARLTPSSSSSDIVEVCGKFQSKQKRTKTKPVAPCRGSASKPVDKNMLKCTNHYRLFRPRSVPTANLASRRVQNADRVAREAIRQYDFNRRPTLSASKKPRPHSSASLLKRQDQRNISSAVGNFRITSSAYDSRYVRNTEKVTCRDMTDVSDAVTALTINKCTAWLNASD